MSIQAQRKPKEVRTSDKIFRWCTSGPALLLCVVLAGLGVQLLVSSIPSLKHFGVEFLLGRSWDPVRGIFGALPFIYGTLVTSCVALLIALPVGIAAALYLSELAPEWVRSPLGFMIELLAAVPSVIYGLWGVFTLAPAIREVVQPALASTLGFLPFFQGPQYGFGMLTAGIIVAIMVLPTITAVSREVVMAIPLTLREAAWGLGATRWEAIRFAVLPAARSGLVGAGVLALGRALGETMAVTMVIGNRPEISASLFSPGYSMASVIANEFTEATDELHLSALAEIGLLLLVLTIILNVAARALVGRVKRAW
ncbi:MAG: hypothetical protein RJA70_1912 [Pseudomonadota bacterium]